MTPPSTPDTGRSRQTFTLAEGGCILFVAAACGAALRAPGASAVLGVATGLLILALIEVAVIAIRKRWGR